ncbi:hypothetical protein V2J94_16860 [Streptomyces sp. DSM 41524]|uniref:Uncharacterized protein n=1 Tax=Streptomyces asiaticus subsp. ignotus TaxID=3098222 RepID=A0ABU7PXH4_9ACTN|nr:hypothetical protein [Streptomyces sp. DSM 41524]
MPAPPRGPARLTGPRPGAVGLAASLVSPALLRGGRRTSPNVRGAFLGRAPSRDVWGEHFDVGHRTFQLEPGGHADHEAKLCH